MQIQNILSSIPIGLRDPLLAEYNSVVKNFMEKRWTPASLSGGKFCEIVYTIIDGYARNNYPTVPSKPRNFVQACRNLENNNSVPRSFKILIPRILPALYEIRNNRSIGHVGGDVDPNQMDATAVLNMTSWIMAELIRVFHSTSTSSAQDIVDSITERKIPLVWESGSIKRVLNPNISYKDQILLLLATSFSKVLVQQLFEWLDINNKPYFMKIIREMHSKRVVELSIDEKSIEILPTGSALAEKIIDKNKNFNA